MKIFLTVLLLLVLVVPSFAIEGVTGGAAPESEVEFFDPFEAPPAAHLPDPLEPLNRAAFWLNDKVYTHLLKPVCLSIPAEVRDEIGTWVKNLGEPLRLGSAELDFKFRDAGSEVGRFVLHGFLQLLDRVDPARTAALAEGREDFSSVLESYGVGPGFYLVLPVLGPSSLREGIGRITSFYLDPAPSLLSLRGEFAADQEWSLLADLQTYESIRRSTLDPYLSIRDAYAQQQGAERRRDFVSLTQAGGRPIGTLASFSNPRPLSKGATTPH